MKLSPHEILNYLGFDIDEEGVELNENDAFYLSESLRLAGNTLNIDNIPEKDLLEFRNGLAGIVSEWMGKEAIDENKDSSLKLRVSIEVILCQTFKYRKPN